MSQVFLFVFLFAVAAGTIAGGPLGDRFGRKIVIWVSILGVAPFSLALPHVGLAWTVILTVLSELRIIPTATVPRDMRVVKHFAFITPGQSGGRFATVVPPRIRGARQLSPLRRELVKLSSLCPAVAGAARP